MLSKLSDIVEENNMENLITIIKSQTNEEDDNKIRNLLEQNNLDHISVIRQLLGIKPKVVSEKVQNVNREKYILMRKFIDQIYANNK